ncbi:TOMM precursor leader peptide-binding protein [Streptomyces radicis]|uniref:Transcriptional activator protein n=1 Tax=Streptomyces radicis TaxID=1750517 RepID=A0A3A9W099_9ACTN|nr:TOMM precursor leader peptide-binding protein [Streptomyces radicis]RKN06299.1 transcriptional activator protein [Streptomyces radicis]RKN18629.1 transcriptional activator protein [Streptomyces radicis]
MADAFDRLAGTRPRIRRDVLFTRTPGGVLFHNADGGFHLTGKTAYRFASVLVPRLDGSARLDELCAGVGDAQKAMVATLVDSLLERGFARDVRDPGSGGAALPDAVSARFAAQIAYVDHYVDGAEGRFARFRGTRVAVLGAGETARWCVLSLVRNGCGAVASEASVPEADAEAAALAADGAPVELTRLPAGRAAFPEHDVVVVTGRDAAPRTHRLLAAGRTPGQLVIPAWTFGERAVVGPRSGDEDADGGGCWSCALLRLGGNVDAAAAAELWSEVAGGASAAAGPPGGALAGPVAAMVGNLLGFEIFRTATGALPPETAGQVLIQDLDSLDVVAEPLHPHPRCRLCAGAPGAPDEAPGELAVARAVTVESARDAEDLVADLNRVSAALVRPHTGVFTRWDDEALPQTPLKVTRLETVPVAGRPRLIAAFDVHHLAGARQRGLRAAAGVWTEHAVPAGTLPGGPGELPTVTPERLTTGGGAFTGDDIAAWTAVTSLLTKERVAVPTAALRPFGPHNRDRLVLGGAAGVGAGATPGEAAGHALLSALAHEALLRAVRGAGRVSLLPAPPERAGDRRSDAERAPAERGAAEFLFLHRSAGTLGVAVELLDLGEAERTGVHVVLARGTGGAAAGRWAVGAELDGRAAAVAALRDLLGAVQLAAATGEEPDPGDPLLADLAPGAIAVTAKGAPADEAWEWGAPVAFASVLERLRVAGRDVLRLADTPADLRAGGLHTARILVTRGGDGDH